MHILELLKEYCSDIVAILGLLSVYVELNPKISVNPWSWILRQVGHKMNEELFNEIDDVKKQLLIQDAKIDNNEKDRIRYEILEFANACRNKQLHTKEEFDHILEQYDKYELIIAKLEQPNGKVTQAMKYITSVYRERQEKNDFLA